MGAWCLIQSRVVHQAFIVMKPALLSGFDVAPELVLREAWFTATQDLHSTSVSNASTPCIRFSKAASNNSSAARA